MKKAVLASVVSVVIAFAGVSIYKVHENERVKAAARGAANYLAFNECVSIAQNAGDNYNADSYRKAADIWLNALNDKYGDISDRVITRSIKTGVFDEMVKPQLNVDTCRILLNRGSLGLKK